MTYRYIAILRSHFHAFVFHLEVDMHSNICLCSVNYLGSCMILKRNVIHGSDTVESAQREIALWFPEGLAGSGEQMGKEWIYE